MVFEDLEHAIFTHFFAPAVLVEIRFREKEQELKIEITVKEYYRPRLAEKIFKKIIDQVGAITIEKDKMMTIAKLKNGNILFLIRVKEYYETHRPSITDIMVKEPEIPIETIKQVTGTKQ